MAGEVKQVPLRLPAELFERIEQARGSIPRERWIREAIEQTLSAPGAGAPRHQRGRTSSEAKRDIGPIPKSGR